MSYQHILVPVDGSKISLSAVQHAAQIAQAFNCQLTLISLVAEDPFTDVDFYYSASIMKEYFAQAQANAKKALQDALAVSKQVGVTATTRIVEGAVSADGIIDAAQALNVDCIVMGSHGRKGVQKFFLGSFAQDVLATATLPVLIVKQ